MDTTIVFASDVPAATISDRVRRGAPVAFIGEAKHRDRRPGLAEIWRLQHLRDLLTAAGHDATDATLGLFSATGFTQELEAGAADSRSKILLVPMETLYGRPS